MKTSGGGLGDNGGGARVGEDLREIDLGEGLGDGSRVCSSVAGSLGVGLGVGSRGGGVG